MCAYAYRGGCLGVFKQPPLSEKQVLGVFKHPHWIKKKNFFGLLALPLLLPCVWKIYHIILMKGKKMCQGHVGVITLKLIWCIHSNVHNVTVSSLSTASTIQAISHLKTCIRAKWVCGTETNSSLLIPDFILLCYIAECKLSGPTGKCTNWNC